MTPTTKAGRALLARVRYLVDEGLIDWTDPDQVVDAIEREAAALAHEHDPDKCDECQEIVMEALRD